MFFQEPCISEGETRKYFFDFVSRQFPEMNQKLKLLYQTGGAPKKYKTNLYAMVNRLRDKYGLSSSYMAPIRQRLGKGMISSLPPSALLVPKGVDRVGQGSLNGLITDRYQRKSKD